MVAEGRTGGAGGFGLKGLLLPPAEELLGSQVLACWRVPVRRRRIGVRRRCRRGQP